MATKLRTRVLFLLLHLTDLYVPQLLLYLLDITYQLFFLEDSNHS